MSQQYFIICAESGLLTTNKELADDDETHLKLTTPKKNLDLNGFYTHNQELLFYLLNPSLISEFREFTFIVISWIFSTDELTLIFDSLFHFDLHPKKTLLIGVEQNPWSPPTNFNNQLIIDWTKIHPHKLKNRGDREYTTHDLLSESEIYRLHKSIVFRRERLLLYIVFFNAISISSMKHVETNDIQEYSFRSSVLDIQKQLVQKQKKSRKNLDDFEDRIFKENREDDYYLPPIQTKH